ncbi:hypothetical protein QBC35DRAFT_281859 [Podospora australis]|uniref:NAD-dependent epimerase/dehydratase domain-containing protein n=1 Tax=Podospora australis TaxID=1536484 RepID=A0AAN6WRQ4_9PEZI|nr:hypothetical protein QBC35DRAFT_281859 [Podospora australis]
MPQIPSTTPLLLPPGALVLVTAVNGLIASHAADQLLAYGYSVRGTVRSVSKNAYLQKLFDTRHGPSKFELVEIPDVSVPGAWDRAVKGVAAVAHVVGSVDLQVQDPDAAAQAEIPWQISLLEACQREGTVESFVFTSSAWSAWTPDPSKKVTVTEDTWNEEAVALARNKDIPAEQKGMAGFMAMKTLIEQGVWDWVRRVNPSFTYNALLLDTVLGECLDPENQGIPSTAGMAQWVWENVHVDVLDMMQPQWHVDCKDAGKLYVALLATKPKIDRRRVFAFGERYSWFQVAEILGQMFPGHREQLAVLKDYGVDQTEVPNQLGLELLQRLGQEGRWRGLRESVKENAESWLKLEKSGVTDHKHSLIAN